MFETVQHYTWCLARPPNTIALFYDTVPDLMRRYSYLPTCNCIVFSSCLWHLIYIVQNLSHNLNFWWPEGPWEAGTIRKATTKAVGSHHVSTGVVCDLCRQSKSRKYTSHYPINPLTCCCLAIISFPQRSRRQRETKTAPCRQIVLWCPWMIWGENHFIHSKCSVKLGPSSNELVGEYLWGESYLINWGYKLLGTALLSPFFKSVL